jgi:ABC-type lipoprotein release transport system permease subunit
VVRAVLARVRTEFRALWRSWLLIALIIAAGAGVSMSLIASSRRTEDTYDRFSQRQTAADVVVVGRSQSGADTGLAPPGGTVDGEPVDGEPVDLPEPPNDPTASGFEDFQFAGAVDLGLVEQLPGVERFARAFASVLFTGTLEDGTHLGPSDVFPVASEDERLGRTIEAWRILEGRRANANSETEAVASFELARRLDLDVGDVLNIQFFTSENFPNVGTILLREFEDRLRSPDARFAFERLADGPRLEIRVVGIEASPAEFPPLLLDVSPVLHLTPAFYESYADELVGSPVSYIRLDDPGSIQAFKTQVERLADGEPTSFISTRALQAQKVDRAINVEAVALAIVGALVALTFTVVVSQALMRQTFVEAGEYATLRALGMAPRQLLAVTLLRCLIIGVVGAALGCALALLLSGATLLGLAEKAELDESMHVDGPVLALGVAAVLVVVTISALVSSAMVLHGAVRRILERRARTAGTTLANAQRRITLPPATAVGVRFALRRDRAAGGVPIWTTVVGASVTIALLVATWVFTSSLDRVTETPRIYGWNWDLRIGAPALPDVGGVVVPALQRDEAVEALAAGTATQAHIGDEPVDLLGMQQIKGTVAPTVVEGRMPEGRREIALGARTMRDVDVDIGDEVLASIGDRSTRLRVVGRAVFPEFGDAGQLGTGGLVTLGALDRLLRSAPRNVFFVKFREDLDVEEQRRRFGDATEPLPHRVEGWPADLESIQRVSALPELFSGMLTGLAVVLLLHTLVTSIRRRRREIAVLEAIGFVRRQVRVSIVMHGVALIAVALLIGVPAGVIAGRQIWKAFASQLGIASNAVIPLLLVSLAVLVALALAALVGVVPAYWATRRRPAAPLRSAE